MRSLFPLKLHYFLNAFGGAPITPFFGVIAKQLGFSGSAIGTMLSVTTICLQFVMPVVGRIMDKKPDKKILTLLLLALGQLVFYWALRFAPSVDNWTPSMIMSCQDASKAFVKVPHTDPCIPPKLQDRSNVDCAFECLPRSSSGKSDAVTFSSLIELEKIKYNDNMLHLEIPPNSCKDDWLCKADCSSDKTFTRVINRPSNENIYSFSAFWTVMILTIGAGICTMSVSSFQDALCHQIVKGTGQTFGHQRVFGSLGYGISALLVGHLIDRASEDTLLYQYSVAFNVMGIAWIANCITIIFLKNPDSIKSKANKDSGASVMDLLRKPGSILFFFFCVCFGFCQGALSFHFLLLEDLGQGTAECADVKALKFLQGLCLASNCLGETPVFIYSGKIIQKLGEERVLRLVLLIFAIRFLFYGFMTSPWQTLAVEMLNGGCIALFLPAMISLAHVIAPEGSGTTMVGLANTATFGLGVSFGSKIAGTLAESSGLSVTFTYFGLFALSALAMSMLLSTVSTKPEEKKTKI